VSESTEPVVEPTAPVVEPVETKPALFAVKGGATDEEVAALTAVLTALAASGGPAHKPETPAWSANHRLVRTTFHHGPSGWRTSSLPR
jgi:hypothetical protein